MKLEVLTSKQAQSSIFKSETERRVLELCETTLGPVGFLTVDVDCRLAFRSLIRVFVERVAERGENGVEYEVEHARISLDDCARISQLLGNILEGESWIRGSYDLEVSSPGLDRRLRVLNDFKGVIGREVKLKLCRNHGLVNAEGREVGENVTGFVVDVWDEGLEIRQGKISIRIGFHQVRQANRVHRY